MNFLVTGGAGFIGSNLSIRLLELGGVTVLDDLSTGSIRNIEEIGDIVFHEVSILDYPDLLDASRNVDFIFHQAALPSVSRSVKDPVTCHDVNVKGTLNVLEVARANGVKKVVYASSSSVYGDTEILPKHESMKPEPLSPYAVSKLSAEHYCRVYSKVYGLPTVCLRYFNVYGPRQDPSGEYSAVVPRFIAKLLEGERPLVYGDGEQTRDFTYVDDVVQANIRAVKTDAEGVYNISYGERTSIKKLAYKIMAITGVKLEIKYCSPRPGDIRHSQADISRARKELNYTPSYNIDKGLKETIEWFRDSLKD